MSKKNKKLVAAKEPETQTTTATETKTETKVTAPTAADAAKAKADADAAKKAAKETAAAAKKAEREAAAAKKKAEREAAKKDKPARTTPAHMAKVDKYAASLPTLSDDAQSVFEQASALETGDLSVLAAHIQLLARKRATASATAVKLEAGNRVRIISGSDTRFIGKEGTVTRCQRIRIFVKVPGFGKDAYLFASDVELVEAEQIDVSDDQPEASATAANG